VPTLTGPKKPSNIKSMSKHKEFLVKQSRKRIVKLQKTVPTLTNDQAKQLKIQVVEPWKRLLLAFTAFVLGFAAYLLYMENITSSYVAAGVAVLSLVFLVTGLFGRKKTVDQALAGAELISLLSP